MWSNISVRAVLLGFTYFKVKFYIVLLLYLRYLTIIDITISRVILHWHWSDITLRTYL